MGVRTSCVLVLILICQLTATAETPDDGTLFGLDISEAFERRTFQEAISAEVNGVSSSNVDPWLPYLGSQTVFFSIVGVPSGEALDAIHKAVQNGTYLSLRPQRPVYRMDYTFELSDNTVELPLVGTILMLIFGIILVVACCVSIFWYARKDERDTQNRFYKERMEEEAKISQAEMQMRQKRQQRPNTQYQARASQPAQKIPNGNTQNGLEPGSPSDVVLVGSKVQEPSEGTEGGIAELKSHALDEQWQAQASAEHPMDHMSPQEYVASLGVPIEGISSFPQYTSDVPEPAGVPTVEYNYIPSTNQAGLTHLELSQSALTQDDTIITRQYQGDPIPVAMGMGAFPHFERGPYEPKDASYVVL